jgi:hypothetical protein
LIKALKGAAGMACVFAIALAIGVFALFHGYADRGLFEIEEVQWYSPTQLAVVAKRADHEALNGDQFFVIIGNHMFSPKELRHAYYGQSVIFRADNSCLTLRWQNQHDLTVTCSDGSIEPGSIAVQRYRSGGVVVSYIKIPNMKQ